MNIYKYNRPKIQGEKYVQSYSIKSKDVAKIFIGISLTILLVLLFSKNFGKKSQENKLKNLEIKFKFNNKSQYGKLYGPSNTNNVKIK